MKQLKNKLLYWAVIVVIVAIIVLTGCQAKERMLMLRTLVQPMKQQSMM